MDLITPFHKIWDQVEPFQLEEPSPKEIMQARMCGYAREFYDWVEEWILPIEGNLIAINQAKVILLDKYMEWRSFVPKLHVEYTSERGHTCIFHIFIQASEFLQVAELRIRKPMLFIPPPPPPQPPGPKLDGPMIYLGKLDE